MIVVHKLINVVNEVTKKVKMSVVEDGKSTTSSNESSKDSSTKNDLKPKLLDLNALSTHMIKEVSTDYIEKVLLFWCPVVTHEEQHVITTLKSYFTLVSRGRHDWLS